MKFNDQLQEAFLSSASEVLEAMFFVEVLGENAEPGTMDLISAELAFNGALSGGFGVQVPMCTGRLMASNFLGKGDEEITQADVEQVTCELTNMICGSVLSRIEADKRFELLHPSITQSGAVTRSPETASSTFELEEGAITVWMKINAKSLN